MLANEQVINGHCERCDTVVEQRILEQWFFRITDYADRLLANLDDKSKMDWSESTVLAQRNWLGRSEGAEIVFQRSVSGSAAMHSAHECHPERSEGPSQLSRPKVFTTRPDTIFGATFMVLAPEHPLVDAFTTARPPGRGGRLPEDGRGQGPGLPQGGRAGEDRRLHRRLRHQPRDRRADSGLDRRLRPDGVRHRRHHGRAGPRRARLRVRPPLRPADRPRRRRVMSPFPERSEGRS